MLGNAYVLLILATLGWGGNAVVGKLASVGWEPFTLTFTRWLLVLLCLLPFAWRAIVKDKDTILKRWHFYFGAGACMALFNLSMYLALNFTTAINVSIEQASMPVFIILANFLVLSQRVTALQIVGVGITIMGVMVTASSGDFAALMKNGLNKGDAIMLVGCFFYAIYTFSLRWKPKSNWITFMFLVAVGATITSLPFAAYEVSQSGLNLPTSIYNWTLLLYVVLIASFASQICFARSVELIGGNRAGLFINLVPIFGSLLAVLIIGEDFRIYHAIGMALVIGGIMLAERFALAEK